MIFLGVSKKRDLAGSAKVSPLLKSFRWMVAQMEVKVSILAAIIGVGLIFIVLWDAFETVVFPRRVTRKVRLTRLFYRNTWRPWSAVVRLVFRGRRQENYLSYFGPLSLILLLSIWAVGLIFGFALLNWASGLPAGIAEGTAGFGTDLYFSGTTFFTLGLGDVSPVTPLARALTVFEAGLGFGFLALVIGYLPALNQSFSKRETNISLLDARAGSPPSAAEMIRRQCRYNVMDTLLQHLSEWERWSAELLESHLSYPVLAFFRSQHDNQSWLAALTTILDTSALVIAGIEGICERQAHLTFAIARHTVVDLSLVFNRPPLKTKRDRLSSDDLARLRASLAAVGVKLRDGDEMEQNLTALRMLYEPYIYSLSQYLRLTVPPWITESTGRDNWQTSAWERRTGIKREGKETEAEDEHF